MRKTSPYKKTTCLLLMVYVVLHQAAAQQKPIHSQYILNNYLLNPALSGIENYTDVKLSYRNQWTGIDGAPVTTYFSFQKPFGHDKEADHNTATSFGKRGANVRGERRYMDYITPAPHHGAGIIVMNDRTGYINRFSTYLTYAYHRPLSTGLTLAAGFQAGFSNTSLDRSKIIWGSLNPNDPAIGFNNGELSNFLPEIGAGLWLYAKDYFIGTSVLNILPGKASFTNASNYGAFYTPHLFVTGGYRFWLSDDITALPSVNLQFVQPFPVQVHTNLKLQYRDIAWIGGGYRISDQLGGMTAMAGFNVSNTFNIGYAYDMTFNSRLSTYSRNSHEIVIGFLLNNSYGDLCPRNVW
jgi:type IX secretion system PorP/SprF family membrane protein